MDTAGKEFESLEILVIRVLDFFICTKPPTTAAPYDTPISLSIYIREQVHFLSSQGPKYSKKSKTVHPKYKI